MKINKFTFLKNIIKITKSSLKFKFVGNIDDKEIH